MSPAVRIFNIKKGLTPPIIPNSLFVGKRNFWLENCGYLGGQGWGKFTSFTNLYPLFKRNLSKMMSFKIRIGLSFAP